MAGLNLFSIPAGAPFLAVLAEALLAGRFGKAHDPGDPTALSRTTLYLPTQRAARALAAILSEKLGGRPLLLPRIVPLGDVDEAETALIAGSGEMLARVAPIEPLQRRLILTRLIAQWGKAANRQHLRLDPAEPALVPSTLAEAWGLAGDLAGLLDQMQTEGVSPERLRGLDAARFDEIWQFNARFLDIVAETWPAILAERGECDPADFRNRMLEAERRRLESGGLPGPVIAAGSTGTVPATARLLATIARLRAPDGCPWDRKQTAASMAPHLLEEAFEAADALRAGDEAHAREELGDVLVNVAMIRQIESKVVNRLRQVTSAIRQDGANRVSIIRSTAERQAAIEFGKAAAVRPAIVGRAMAEISKDADVARTMFEILETQRIVEGKSSLTILRTPTHGLLADLLATEGESAQEGIAGG